MQKAGRYIKSNLWQNIYIICLFVIIFMHYIFIRLLDFLRDEDKVSTNVSSSEYVTMVSVVILEWVLIIFQCKVLYKYIFLTDIKPIFMLYLSKIIAFADIYLLLFKIHPPQFHHPQNVLTPSTTYSDLGFTLLNYSASLQTLTGISAVTPRKGASELLSAAQVLCFGIGYSVFILSIAVLRFAQTDITHQTPNTEINNLLSPFNTSQTTQKQIGLLTENEKLSINSVDPDVLTLSSMSNSSSNVISHILSKTKVKWIKNYLKYAKFYYRFMTLILIFVQTPRLVLMYYICDLECSDNAILTVGIVSDVILLCLCIVCGAIRMRLIKRLGIRINIGWIGLIRSYLTVLIQFGVLYFDIWILTKNRKRSAFNVSVSDANVNKYWSMIGHFLYLSMTTFTNVGSEGAISTHEPLGQILNGLQMIVGIIYHTVVFGVSLLDISSNRIRDTERFVHSNDILTSAQNMKKTNTLRDVGLIQRQIKQIVAKSASNNNVGNSRYVHPAINNLSINDD